MAEGFHAPLNICTFNLPKVLICVLLIGCLQMLATDRVARSKTYNVACILA